MTVHINSSSQWSQVLRGSNIVVTDFYADWCGPCKAIAPTFESLSTKFSKPNKITFAKVNVDNQQAVAQQYGVRAMPTFLILRNGSVIETIQGANSPALSAAVERAAKLAGTAAPGAAFQSGGRTLGGTASGRPRQGITRPSNWDLNAWVNWIITFFGLYLSSLFSLDPYMAAQSSRFNIKNPTGPAAPSSSGPGGQKPGSSAAKSSFRTLSDLGGQ